MASEEIKYDRLELKAIRGGEAKAIDQKQNEGWELVSREQGRLRTTLTFRRPKRKIPWQVLAGAGAAAAAIVAVLAVGAVMESDDEPATEAVAGTSSVAPSSVPAPQPIEEPLPQAATEILTVENSEHFAAILAGTDYCSQSLTAFADQYAGRTIQFDGYIGGMIEHGRYGTLYDIMLNAGNFDPDRSPGPNFLFENVSSARDLELVGPDIFDALGVGDALRITAVVGEFEERSCHFHLDPAVTELR